MLAVPVNQYTVATLDGRIIQVRVDAVSAAVPDEDWQRLSAGAGAKGPRLYNWVRVPIRPLSEPHRYWLLVRRSLTDGELAHYLCLCPPTASLADLVAVAGRRWAIEDSFQTAQREVGLEPLPGPPLRRLVPTHHPGLPRPRGHAAIASGVGQAPGDMCARSFGHLVTLPDPRLYARILRERAVQLRR